MAASQAGMRTGRLYFIDNLRIFLTVSVVVFHVAGVYLGFSREFPFVDPPTSNVTKALLRLFMIVNQAYFMGLFFFISGYFTPDSYDRKGSWVFIKDRLRMLGIPFLMYYFVLSPIAELSSVLADPTAQFSFNEYRNCLTSGPLWFAFMLLCFNFCYMLWRKTAHKVNMPIQINFTPSNIQKVCVFMLVLALVSYFFRIFAPAYHVFFLFPSFGYFPQYISFFILGIIASRQDWLRSIPDSMGIQALVIAVLCSFVYFSVILSSSSLSIEYFEGTAWQSCALALWDSIFSVGFSLWLITIFRRFFNTQGNFTKFLQQQSFAVYVIHFPLIMYVAFFLHNAPLAHPLKCCLAACLGVPLSFVAAYIIRKFPYVDRIL